jgi:hypothetical protein
MSTSPKRIFDSKSSIAAPVDYKASTRWKAHTVFHWLSPTVVSSRAFCLRRRRRIMMQPTKVTDPVQDDQAQGDSAPAWAAEPPPQAEPSGGGVTGRAGGGATYQAAGGGAA